MGMYLNPTNANFLETLRQPIFVDKTGILIQMNKFIDICNKYVCVARPRRFGKTIATEMLTAYYSKGCDSRELLSKFEIGQDPHFLEKLNKYNFIRIDLNAEFETCRNKDEVLNNLQNKIIKEFQEYFTGFNFPDYFSIADAIQKIFDKTNEQFIIIIDEYDVFVREQVNGNVSDKLFREYLGFLNGLFKNSTLKPAIALAYLTGILPIVRDKIQSKLNVFEEYTMIDAQELSKFVGFTENEVIDLCKKNNLDFEECKRWYDGYRLSKIIFNENNERIENYFDIYNPRSVVKVLQTGKFENYWTQTSSYQVIVDRINQNFDGTKEAVIQMIAGESVDVDAYSYLNTMTDFRNKNDAFTYLIHLGYLVYDRNNKTCAIPNGEIRQEWQRAIYNNDEYQITNEIIKSSKELLELTLEGDEEAVAKALDKSHIHVTSNRSYNNEDALQSAIYLAYIYALNKYTIVREMTAGKGFADVTFVPYLPNIPAIIIELKHNEDTRTALNQIKQKQYFESLTQYFGDLLFVGINYDEKSKTHTCKIEKFIK